MESQVHEVTARTGAAFLVCNACDHWVRRRATACPCQCHYDEELRARDERGWSEGRP